MDDATGGGGYLTGTVPGTPAAKIWAGAALWLALSLAVVLAFRGHPSALSNDATQYLSGGANLLAGRGYATSILFFDEHYRFGVIPAPQTVWPPGYSALIAAGGALGLPLEASARLVPAIAFVLLLPAFFLLAHRVTGRLAGAMLGTVWLFAVTELWFYTTMPNSEAPFLLLTVLALLALPRKAGDDRRWLLAGVAGALAGAVRYAGVFFLAALGLVSLLEAWRRSRRAGRVRPGAPLWFAAGTLPFALILARNYVLTGAPAGGNTKAVTQPVGDLAATTVVSLSDLMVGVTPGVLRSGTMALGLGLLALAGLAILLGTAAWSVRRGFDLDWEDPIRLGIVAYPVVYVAAIVLTASRTMLTYGPRYLLPVVPFLILWIILPIIVHRSGASPRGPRASVVVSAALLTILGAQLFSVSRRREGRTETRATDPALHAWVAEQVPAGEAIMIVGDGQLWSYRLERPAAAVPHQRFTAREWGADEIRTVLADYRIRFLVITAAAREASYGPFLDGLIAGGQATWLEDLGQTSGARLLRSRR